MESAQDVVFWKLQQDTFYDLTFEYIHGKIIFPSDPTKELRKILNFQKSSPKLRKLNAEQPLLTGTW